MRKQLTVDDIIEMENKIIRETLKKWKAESRCGHPFQYKYSLIDNGTLFIYTCEPARLIGKQGNMVNKYTAYLTRDLGKSGFRRVEFIEVDPYLI